ncbi:MAG: phosphatidylserine/phosphatidylglycerophosphate/cardiolipin synthase family protein [Aureispira sp.]|nr:phosphatidylserine/phosphatidylglycerophosphate/cardiolipin synthase family protein [Aureispira sp.]
MKFIYILLFIVCNYTAKADNFRILNNEQEALLCRLALIDSAQEEILMAYFGWSADAVGLELFNRLIKAAERGAKVQLVLDAYASGDIDNGLLTYLAERGVHVKIYNEQKFLGVRSHLQRMHDKFMVVDGESIIVGGRNMREYYFGMKEKAFSCFLDREALVHSPSAAAAAMAYFDVYWNQLSIVTYRKKVALTTNQIQHFDSLRVDATIKITNHLELVKDSLGTILEAQKVDSVRFMHDTYKDDVYKSLSHTLNYIELIDQARDVIYIENPYFAPTKKWLAAFDRAIKRGVKIRVMTNSCKTNDESLMHGLYLNMRKKVLDLGLELWEYQGPKLLHAKCMIIDNKLSIIGSYNINKMSQTHTSEVNVVVKHIGIAQEHKSYMDQNLKDAIQILTGEEVEEVPEDRKKHVKGILKKQRGVCRLIKPLFR